METLAIENRTEKKLSPELLKALERRSAQLNYSTLLHVFHAVWLHGNQLVGVAGDGDNGGYEWFTWDGNLQTLQTSDCGYGAVGIALRDVLVAEEPISAADSAPNSRPRLEWEFQTNLEEARWRGFLGEHPETTLFLIYPVISTTEGFDGRCRLLGAPVPDDKERGEMASVADAKVAAETYLAEFAGMLGKAVAG